MAAEVRIVAQHNCLQQQPQRALVGRLHRLPFDLKVSLGSKAHPGDVHGAPIHPDLPDRHLVGGQRARLVGANGRCRAQRVHSLEPPDDGVAPGHAVDADGEGNGHHRRQPFWDGRDRRGQSKQEHLLERKSAQQAQQQGQCAHRQRQQTQRLSQVERLSLQGRLGFFCLLDQRGDLAHLGLCSSGKDGCPPSPLRDDRPGKDQVGPLCQKKIFRQGTGRLADGHRLAGQHRLVDLELHRLKEPALRRYFVSRAKHDHVAWHDLGSLDPHLQAFPPLLAAVNLGLWRSSRPQRIDRFFRPVLLEEPDQGVDNQHDRDDRGICRLARQERDHGCCYQHDNQRVLDLLDQEGDRAHPLVRLDRIRTVLRQALLRLRLAQPLRACTQRSKSLLNAQRVPCFMFDHISSLLYPPGRRKRAARRKGLGKQGRPPRCP